MAAPLLRSSSRMLRTFSVAPTSRPRVGEAAMVTWGCCEISRARMTFCRLPPLSRRACVSGPGVEMLYSIDQAFGLRAHFAAVDEDAAADGSVCGSS